ncbi:hypothetical protein niasHT_032388 [Heterodera trifolii]|uniref:Uncharacterized protein n=1 Tax=Heterodera trifolii TaxID=157864 RepID=A0ABD2I370_9BILA
MSESGAGGGRGEGQRLWTIALGEGGTESVGLNGRILRKRCENLELDHLIPDNCIMLSSTVLNCHVITVPLSVSNSSLHGLLDIRQRFHGRQLSLQLIEWAEISQSRAAQRTSRGDRRNPLPKVHPLNNAEKSKSSDTGE